MFSATIIKNFANYKLTDLINEFFKNCGFIIKEFPKGMKITDDDFEYLPETLSFQTVSCKELNDVVTESKHGAFVCKCYDTEEECYYETIIPADCTIGKWKE